VTRKPRDDTSGEQDGLLLDCAVAAVLSSIPSAEMQPGAVFVAAAIRATTPATIAHSRAPRRVSSTNAPADGVVASYRHSKRTRDRSVRSHPRRSELRIDVLSTRSRLVQTHKQVRFRGLGAHTPQRPSADGVVPTLT
jgi:hypothetical protein